MVTESLNLEGLVLNVLHLMFKREKNTEVSSNRRPVKPRISVPWLEQLRESLHASTSGFSGGEKLGYLSLPQKTAICHRLRLDFQSFLDHSLWNESFLTCGFSSNPVECSWETQKHLQDLDNFTSHPPFSTTVGLMPRPTTSWDVQGWHGVSFGPPLYTGCGTVIN